MYKYISQILKCLPVLALLLLPQVSHAERVYDTGFEKQTLTAGIEISSNGLTNGTIDTTTKRSGSASLRIHETTTSFSWFGQVFKSVNSTPGFCRVYIYISDMPDAGHVEICSAWDSVGVAPQAQIYLQSDGTLVLSDDIQVAVGSPSSALTTGHWYCVQMEVVPNAVTGIRGAYVSAPDGACVGDNSVNAFARETDGAVDNFDAFYFGTANTDDANFDIYFDDLAINDNASTGGTTQTTLPPDGKIVTLNVTGNGDTNPSGCNNTSPCGDTATYWQYIDEVTPDDATTFVDVDTAISPTFNVTDSATAGIGSTDTISLVHVHTRLREETSATTVYNMTIMSASGGTKISTTGSGSDIGTTAWRTNPIGGNNQQLKHLATSTLPASASPWTPTGTNSIDNMQIGTSMVSGTADFDVTAMWVNVEYVPAVAVAPAKKGWAIIWFN